jgi:hypothetical protein
MLLYLLNRRERWEVHQQTEELPKSFVLCLLTGLRLFTQGGDPIEPDVREAQGDASFHLYWVRDGSIWTVGFGVGDTPLRGAVQDGWCVITSESFLVRLPQPEGCGLGPPTSRERFVVKDQWDRLLGGDLV